ncbi:hypothetical protein GCM10023115_38810 [Pontixanthobacter gangjinensis]|uniref:DUF2975 domain-containing protein n=1 Tax=Christiangramia aestuarii TaxID=1028746 RepID=A0A7M3SWK2_9FLAO|nr:DUF2975 domain-containing protein [Christiangramia aestuarii]MUP40983.1 DUF2975 domain-containing protein [Christiangramia aestuarii]
MNNRILKITALLARFMQAGYALLILFFLYLGISSFFNWPLPESVGANSWLKLNFSADEEIIDSSFNRVFFSVQSIGIYLLFILTLQALVKVISSIKSLNAFRKESIAEFRKIGMFIFLVFLIGAVKLSYINNSLSIEFSPDLEYLLIALLSWVIAEVFKEGNRLWEENELTI